MAINWEHVGAELLTECPSPETRRATADILERTERLGPLRSPAEEFKRVYRFIHWNEPERVLRIITGLLERSNGRPIAKANAWGYVVAALDEWITHARVFYLVSGILESALRAQLDAHLTDLYGTRNWPAIEGTIPSGLRDSAERERHLQNLSTIAQLVENSHDAPENQLEQIRVILKSEPLEELRGSELLRNLSFGGLRMFFERGKSWSGMTKLQDIFRGRNRTQSPPQRDKVLSVLATLNKARNEVSHYRPEKYVTLEHALFAAALLTTWLGEDVQHIYGSIDTRNSTELSLLVRPIEPRAWASREEANRCADDSCGVPKPFDWLLQSAPVDETSLAASVVQRACAFHRVLARTSLHRPPDRIES